MNILVTGGAGFIGAHLVHWLCRQGHHVRVIDNLSTGRWERLAPIAPQIHFVEGDIRNLALLEEMMQQVAIVFHLAAMVSVVQSVAEPLLAHEINATGSLCVFEAARRSGVQRVVQMSSCAVYGEAESIPTNETVPPAPHSPYALTKLQAEHIGSFYTRCRGVEVVALRGFNIYGPWQDPTSPYAAVIPRFIDALRSGKQPTIYGDGLQTRDFVFVGDVVQALWRAATTPGIGGEIFNIGRGRACTILDLAHIIGEVMGMVVQPTFAPPREGEVLHSCADISRLAARVGYTPQTSLHQGLRITIEETNRVETHNTPDVTC